MGFDEFSEKLHEIKKEYGEAYKKELKTIEELEAYLVRRKMRFGKRRNLTSLKGIKF